MDKVTLTIKRNQDLMRLSTSLMESKKNENKAYSEGSYSVPVELTGILHAEFIKNINNLFDDLKNHPNLFTPESIAFYELHKNDIGFGVFYDALFQELSWHHNN